MSVPSISRHGIVTFQEAEELEFGGREVDTTGAMTNDLSPGPADSRAPSSSKSHRKGGSRRVGGWSSSGAPRPLLLDGKTVDLIAVVAAPSTFSHTANRALHDHARDCSVCTEDGPCPAGRYLLFAFFEAVRSE